LPSECRTDAISLVFADEVRDGEYDKKFVRRDQPFGFVAARPGRAADERNESCVDLLVALRKTSMMRLTVPSALLV